MNLCFKSLKNFAFTYPCPRKLREIMKLSLIERENKDQITQLWQNYHKMKLDNISHTLEKQQYDFLLRKTQECPMFICPVKREGGFFNLIGQNQRKSFLFTFMEDFKLKGVHASPYLIITMFDELLVKRGIALVRGDIIDMRITKKEAENVWSITKQLFFDPHCYEEFVMNFNHRPDNFNFEKFKKEFELV